MSILVRMVTKRQLGIAFIASGFAAALVVMSVNWLGLGNYAGIGPMQRIALTVAGLLVVVGATLLPLGNRPA